MATQKTGPTGLSADFDTEWADAQTRYQQAIDAGYEPEDANQLYLQPVANKWKIIQSSPALLRDPEKLSAFKNEYDSSAKNFVKSFNDYSRDNGQWAFSRTLQPTLQKWDVGATIPQPPEVTPLDEVSALKAVKEGDNPLDVLAENPKLLSDPNTRTTMNELIRKEINLQNRLAPEDATQLQALRGTYKTDLTSTTADDAKRQADRDAIIQFQQLHQRGGLQPQPPGTMTSTGPVAPVAAPANGPAPAAPISTVPQPGLRTGIPDLSSNPDAVAKLPNGSVYNLNGHELRASHATPLPPGASIAIGDDPEYGDMSAQPSLQPMMPGQTLVPDNNRYTAAFNSGAKIQTVQTADDYAALGSGESYYDAAGNLRRKK